MRLDSGAFLAIFAAFFVVYSVASPAVKRVLLVAGSIAFYTTLAARFVPLLLGLGIFTFFIAGRLHRATSQVWRDRLLWIGVGVNVLALAFFKVGARPLQVAVPVGISFYTLQAISCVIDVHRGVYAPRPSLLSFLASFTLFPHLLSGPIVRSSFLVPLIDEIESARWETARRALLLFAVGLAKKGIADKLAPTADAAFDAPGSISGLTAWTGLLAYAGQLYGDFSGYTDMATALARLLGLDLPPNFNLPYLATSPADFWRRWHISLSTWLRDYVYIPLGVRLRRRHFVNVVLTWIVAGLWHGVSSLFFVYGLYHGVLIATTDWLSRRFGDGEEPKGLRRVGQTALTFYLVLMGYVLFRARSGGAALRFFLALHAPRVPSSRDGITTAAGCVLALVACHLLDAAMKRAPTVVERGWIMWPALALTVACLSLLGATAQPFIYFAF